MLGLISIVGPKPGETGKEPGLKKAENPILAINYTLKPILITVLIRSVETTPANAHDSQIDLNEPGKVVYMDRGYFGAPCKGYNSTMDRNVRGHKITIRQKLRSQRIKRKRAPWERSFAVIKNIFRSGHQLVTTIQ